MSSRPSFFKATPSRGSGSIQLKLPLNFLFYIPKNGIVNCFQSLVYPWRNASVLLHSTSHWRSGFHFRISCIWTTNLIQSKMYITEIKSVHYYLMRLCVIVALHLKFNYTFSCVRSLVKKRSNCNFLYVWLSGVFHHQGYPSIMRIRFLSWAISYYCSVFLRPREYNSCWIDQRGTFGESICFSCLHCFSNVDVYFCNCDKAEWRTKKKKIIVLVCTGINAVPWTW